MSGSNNSIFLVFILSCLAVAYNCTTGNRHGYDKTDKDISYRYNKICIDGHVFYERRAGHGFAIANGLNHDGTPTKCQRQLTKY